MALAAAVVALLVGAALNAMVSAEYARWATPLARALVWIAGTINPYRRDEWTADLAALQQEERDPALTVAVARLAAAPWLVIAETAQRSIYWLRRNTDRDRVGNGLVSISAATSTATVGWYAVGPSWPLITMISGNFVVGIIWGVFDKDAEDGPEALLPLLGMIFGLCLGLGAAIQFILPVGRFAVPLVFSVVLAWEILSDARNRSRKRRRRNQAARASPIR